LLASEKSVFFFPIHPLFTGSGPLLFVFVSADVLEKKGIELGCE